jgi:flagellar basal-body rod protein FlgC
MSSFKIFDIAGSAMSAQNTRLNLVASNMANAETISSSIDKTYRSRQPVFATALKDAMERANEGKGDGTTGVKVLGIVESPSPLRMEYQPDHPMANADGYIFKPNVNTMEEMANMISASRSYQDNVSVFDTAKQLVLQTLRMGE